MIFDLAQIIGWIATFLFSIMVLPQMLKTIKTKETSGVSLGLFVIYLVAAMNIDVRAQDEDPCKTNINSIECDNWLQKNPE